MEIKIPQNQISKISQFKTNTLGDFVETFNVDLTKNYGSIMATRMTKASNLSGDEISVAFKFFNGRYYTVAGEYVKRTTGQSISNFSNVTGDDHPNDISQDVADLEEFNEFLYVSGTGNGDGVHKYSGTSWTVVSASGLSSNFTPHLMKQFGDLLYIVDGTRVGHITSGDVLNLTGTATFDPGLSPLWTITMLESSFDSLFIGYHNIQTNEGLIFEWDGGTENIAIRKYILDSGCLGGTVLGGIPYYFDTRGRLMRYAGTSFILAGQIQFKSELSFNAIDSINDTTERPLHPNGITTTDDGKILLLFKDGMSPTSGGEPNTFSNAPSGVYEYEPNVGLYHKYSISSGDEYGGDLRIARVGAVYFRRPNSSPASNGNFIVGARAWLNSTETEGGVFINDTMHELTKYAYLITPDIFTSGINEEWNKIYVKYKKLLNSADKVVVKYKTEGSELTEVTCFWADETRLLTSADLSAYSQGDEIQIIQGMGSGRSAHIKDISPLGSGYSILLDTEFSGVSGDCKVWVDKWIKSGEITFTDTKQWKELPIPKKNSSPMIKLKIVMEFNGDDEINRIHINTNKNI